MAEINFSPLSRYVVIKQLTVHFASCFNVQEEGFEIKTKCHLTGMHWMKKTEWNAAILSIWVIINY